ncbi:hypothetical protein GOP47_0000744 [Adiantum capillus-veneris]|uniref:Nuclear pore complex protein NUP205 n=1 Tax=Adiantum capillus-veneris TaxID=13818 RepID=A0A9D4VEI7_ADICA|nr:hypothetical protein GOP47_0000744 [Adiantum capillus-veneris]
MVSHRQLLTSVEAALLAGPHLPALQRAELAHLLHISLPDFRSFLQHAPPSNADRAQVLAKEVRSGNGSMTPLDDQDVQIALKLSDDLHLNELECVSLLVAAHQEWILFGREPLEILRLSEGLWFTERRALITTLQLLLRAVVLDDELDPDLVADIQQYVENLLKAGLRRNLITLVKDLSREEPAGCGGPGVEQFVLDSRGSLVRRSNVSMRERLSLCQCLVFSGLIVRIEPQEMRELYSLLKDCSHALNGCQENVKLQIAYTILFVIVIALISDALSGTPEVPSILSINSAFHKEFQEQILENAGDDLAEGFGSIVRLTWAIFLMLIASSRNHAALPPPSSSVSSELGNASLMLDKACDSNAFKFIVEKVLKTPAFQNDDDDMIFMYCAYLHKMLTSLLSQPQGRDKVKTLRDSAMVSLETFYYDSAYASMNDEEVIRQQRVQAHAQPFLSLLALITEVYQREPELTVDNDALWNFARFVSENHTNHVSLVAFLAMLTGLASSEEGSRKVYVLLQNKASWSVSWHTLFSSLSVYEQQFKQSLQTTGALLPPFQEGDARALEAYLRVLKQVMENGNKHEKSHWFPDIEPLFKLLSYENVPPSLKGALRDAIATFSGISPVMRERIWSLLEQYDLPLAAGSSSIGYQVQSNAAQIYDMAFELNEVEARREEYSSTLSYINLLNDLIACDTDAADKGARFLGIFKFVRDHVFATFSQRAYSDSKEKWQLVVACLKHFKLMLSLFSPTDDDIQNQVDYLPEFKIASAHELHASSMVTQPAELPTIEVMKDLMSGKTIFRNLMNIVMLGVNTIMEERVTQCHGPQLEEAINLSLELVLLGLSKDAVYADFWRPVYHPVDAVLSHDSRQIISLLEYIRYDASQTIQQSSIKIMSILSARQSQLVSIILEAGVADNLIEDYAACLEARSQDANAPESFKEDSGFLILQLLISNLRRPAPNITHLLLKFDVDGPVERTVLQPKRHFSCLRILLNVLEKFSRPEVNAALHEAGLQLFYDLCVDSLTSLPTIELLQSEKYKFFSKHLDMFACEPLSKRKANQVLRTSQLHQRAWLLKLFAVQLHVSDMDVITQRANCQHLLSQLFSEETESRDQNSNALTISGVQMLARAPSSNLQRMKVLELLDIVQFQPPDIEAELPWELQGVKEDLMVTEILASSVTIDEGGVYYHSERGDRLIELTAFRDRLWQEYKHLELQQNVSFNEQRQVSLREAVQHLLRWAWKFNKNVEEQASQLHMLVGWSQLVEVGISRRFDLLDFRLHILFEILDASLTASISQDCSLKMAICLSQVVMTCMAKLQELSFSCPSGEDTDDVTCVDLLFSTRLSNSACQTILSKLLAAMLRHETSETLRSRQYSTLISYLHYCQGTIDPDLSLPVMRALLLEGQDGEQERDLEKLDKEQAELQKINLAAVKTDVVSLINVLTKDLSQGSEMGKAMACYALDALLGIDSDLIILSQLQNRGLLQACLVDVSTNSYQAVLLPSPASVRRLYTLEAELALLLRVGYQNKKRGAQTLFAMGVLQHLTSCRAIDVQLSEDAKWEQVVKSGTGLRSQHDRHHQIVSPVLRIVLCLATLIDPESATEKGGDEVTSEILEFVRGHHGLFARILRDDKSGVQLDDLEELDLVTAILSKVWHLGTTDEWGFSQALYNLASVYFIQEGESKNRFVCYVSEAKRFTILAPGALEVTRRMELLLARVRCNLISFLFCMVAKQGMRFHISDPILSSGSLLASQFSLGRHRQPTLSLIASLLEQCFSDLEAATEERSLLLAKVQDVNELSCHEVDDIIKAYSRVEHPGETEGIRKRRYVAMVEMCSAAGNRESVIAIHLLIIEHALNILFIHYDEEFQVPDNLRDRGENMDNVKSFLGSSEEFRSLNEKLLPLLQQIERMNEERTTTSSPRWFFCGSLQRSILHKIGGRWFCIKSLREIMESSLNRSVTTNTVFTRIPADGQLLCCDCVKSDMKVI